MCLSPIGTCNYGHSCLLFYTSHYKFSLFYVIHTIQGPFLCISFTYDFLALHGGCSLLGFLFLVLFTTHWRLRGYLDSFLLAASWSFSVCYVHCWLRPLGGIGLLGLVVLRASWPSVTNIFQDRSESTENANKCNNKINKSNAACLQRWIHGFSLYFRTLSDIKWQSNQMQNWLQEQNWRLMKDSHWSSGIYIYMYIQTKENRWCAMQGKHHSSGMKSIHDILT